MGPARLFRSALSVGSGDEDSHRPRLSPFGDSVIRSPSGCSAPSLSARVRGGVASFGHCSSGSGVAPRPVAAVLGSAGRRFGGAARPPVWQAWSGPRPARAGGACFPSRPPWFGLCAGRPGLEGSLGVSRASPAGRTQCVAQRSVRAHRAIPEESGRTRIFIIPKLWFWGGRFSQAASVPIQGFGDSVAFRRLRSPLPPGPEAE